LPENERRDGHETIRPQWAGGKLSAHDVGGQYDASACP
jgi:hypothetical protein